MTKKEKNIYKAILAHFPKTSKETAKDMALNGVKFQFINNI